MRNGFFRVRNRKRFLKNTCYNVQKCNESYETTVKINASANGRLIIHLIEGQNQDVIWLRTYLPKKGRTLLHASISHAILHLDVKKLTSHTKPTTITT